MNTATENPVNTPAALFARAVEADNAFHAECVRQFGRDAGDCRYMPELHDERTRAAADRLLSALDAHRDAMLGKVA